MTAESKPETAPNPKVTPVYIGPCTTTDKVLGGKFLPITDEQLRAKSGCPTSFLEDMA